MAIYNLCALSFPEKTWAIRGLRVRVECTNPLHSWTRQPSRVFRDQRTVSRTLLIKNGHATCPKFQSGVKIIVKKQKKSKFHQLNMSSDPADTLGGENEKSKMSRYKGSLPMCSLKITFIFELYFILVAFLQMCSVNKCLKEVPWNSRWW